MTESVGPPSYSTAEVARRLGVSIPTVQRWVDAGHLRAWKTVGGHRRIEAESAERLFAARDSNAETIEPGNGNASLSVMLVDDNPDDRDILVALVQTALPGARISIAENGFQALVAIGRAVPDILITDIVMPNMNGVQMLRELSTECEVRPAAIIAVSSKTPAQFAKLGQLPKDVSFVPKPFDQFQVIAALQVAALKTREAALNASLP